MLSGEFTPLKRIVLFVYEKEVHLCMTCLINLYRVYTLENDLTSFSDFYWITLELAQLIINTFKSVTIKFQAGAQPLLRRGQFSILEYQDEISQKASRPRTGQQGHFFGGLHKSMEIHAL